MVQRLELRNKTHTAAAVDTPDSSYCVLCTGRKCALQLDLALVPRVHCGAPELHSGVQL